MKLLAGPILMAPLGHGESIPASIQDSEHTAPVASPADRTRRDGPGPRERCGLLCRVHVRLQWYTGPCAGVPNLLIPLTSKAHGRVLIHRHNFRLSGKPTGVDSDSRTQVVNAGRTSKPTRFMLRHCPRCTLLKADSCQPKLFRVRQQARRCNRASKSDKPALTSDSEYRSRSDLWFRRSASELAAISCRSSGCSRSAYSS